MKWYMYIDSCWTRCVRYLSFLLQHIDSVYHLEVKQSGTVPAQRSSKCISWKSHFVPQVILWTEAKTFIVCSWCFNAQWTAVANQGHEIRKWSQCAPLILLLDCSCMLCTRYQCKHQRYSFTITADEYQKLAFGSIILLVMWRPVSWGL